MTENMQADSVQSRQAGFVRCCLKYSVIIGIYRETQYSDAFNFIKKNYIKMARYFIENDCEKNLTLLAQYSEFTSRKRLNDLIKLAEEYHNQKIYDLLIGMK